MSEPADTLPAAAAPAPVPEAAAPAPARALSGPLWAAIGLIAVAAALAGAVAGRLLQGEPARFAIADVEEVFAIAQLQMTDLITGKDVSDREREQAFELASQFGPKIEAALDAIQADCRCLLLVRGAVARGRLPDYTDGLKRAIGVQGLDVAALKKKVAEQQASALAAPQSQAPNLPLGFLNALPVRQTAR
jgi:hypothetical protein